jgi:hypothetical protein
MDLNKMRLKDTLFQAQQHINNKSTFCAILHTALMLSPSHNIRECVMYLLEHPDSDDADYILKDCINRL